MTSASAPTWDGVLRQLAATLAALPGDDAYESLDGPAYHRWIAVTETAAAARFLISSLEVLGALPSDPLELTTGG